MARPGRLRITLGWMILLVALAALGIDALRPVGTKVVDVKVGAGPEVRAGDVVSVHYVGKLADGTVFDSSRARGRPFDFEVGRGVVIRGWDAGLVGMRVGGVRRLVIPPGEGYGAKGAGPAVPPDSTLYFEVELEGRK